MSRSPAPQQKKLVLMFNYWLRFGIKKGWVSKPFCSTHDGGLEYYNEEELEELEEGGDPCQVVVVVL